MRDYTAIETLCLKFCRENSELSEKIEKLEKENQDLNLLKTILKKKVNIYDIWRLDTYEEYKKEYPFATYHEEKDILTKSEFELLKEMIENE